MIRKSDCGVWMFDEDRCVSVARAVAEDCMKSLGLDPSDFMVRDKIVLGISDGVERILDEVSGTAQAVRT